MADYTSSISRERIMKNYNLRDQIRDYWSGRAEAYDLGRGHGIAQQGERDVWLDLIRDKLGPANGRSALDLATGTGEIAQLMQASGFAVTGMDFTEAMLNKAKAKAETRNLPIRYVLRDVEQTHEADDTYDILICRNLVWTLVDPAASFSEWLRVLKPAGTLMIVDADHITTNWVDRLHRLWGKWFGAKPDGHSLLTPEQWSNHYAIVEQLPYKRGARAEIIASALSAAGFVTIEVDTKVPSLRSVQAAGQGWTGWLRSKVRHRFVICASKPGCKGA
jgi:ubiquinone/menaquinone biosynthesis C-methylase UbiE